MTAKYLCEECGNRVELELDDGHYYPDTGNNSLKCTDCDVRMHPYKLYPLNLGVIRGKLERMGVDKIETNDVNNYDDENNWVMKHLNEVEKERERAEELRG